MLSRLLPITVQAREAAPYMLAFVEQVWIDLLSKFLLLQLQETLWGMGWKGGSQMPLSHQFSCVPADTRLNLL